MHYLWMVFAPTSALNETATNKSFAFDVEIVRLELGILLAVKALVQLIITPFVTSLIDSYVRLSHTDHFRHIHALHGLIQYVQQVIFTLSH